MLDIFFTLINHWPVFAGVLALAGVALFFLVPAVGRQLLIPVGIIFTTLLAYWSGKRNERNAQEERTKKISQKREQAYRDIADRNTDRDDVVDRLQRNDF